MAFSRTPAPMSPGNAQAPRGLTRPATNQRALVRPNVFGQTPGVGAPGKMGPAPMSMPGAAPMPKMPAPIGGAPNMNPGWGGAGGASGAGGLGQGGKTGGHGGMTPPGSMGGAPKPMPTPGGFGHMPGGNNTNPGWNKEPGGGAGTPAPTTDPGAGSTMDDIDAFYNDILADDEAAWGKQQGMLQEDMGGFMREADVMNARMGRSMGGGYASMAGAALGKGMRAYNEADLAHGDRRRQLQLAYLDRQLEEKRRQEDRGWQNEDNDKADEMSMLQQMMGMEGFEMTPDMIRMIEGMGIDPGALGMDADRDQTIIDQSAEDKKRRDAEMLARAKTNTSSLMQSLQGFGRARKHSSGSTSTGNYY